MSEEKHACRIPRRQFGIQFGAGLAGLAFGSPLANAHQPRRFDRLSASIADIHAAVDAGALTYERVVQIYLRRVESYDRNGPKLRVVVEI